MPSCKSSAYPRIAASGVLSSWLMLATNCDLWWLAISRILDSFGKLAGSRLRLFEKARVFNRDDGLVGEGVDEFDLTFGERAHFGAPDEDYANCLACVDQGHGERG